MKENNNSQKLEERVEQLEQLLKESSQKKKPDYMLPISIVLAGVLISSFIFFSDSGTPAANQPNNQPPEITPEEIAANLNPVDSDDYIRGNTNASVTIIEFSDYECPFCKEFHSTMKEILNSYDGKVRWVYRHSPIDAIHPQATPAALAAECVGELAGNDAFWEFSDAMFENQDTLGEELYLKTAQDLGVEASALTSCIESGKYSEKITKHASEAKSVGLQGTPYSIVVGPNGNIKAISGALPIDQVKNAIDSIM